MHRFHLPPADCREDTLRLRDTEAHHALHVLRLQPGDSIIVLDGAGARLHCTVGSTGKKELVLNVVQRELVQRTPFQLTLFQSILKGKAMEMVIQKATELGVFRIIPVRSEYTVSQLDDDRSELKVAKWEAIALESIKQCGSAWLPEIQTPQSLAKAIENSASLDLSLVASLQQDAIHPRARFDQFATNTGRNPCHVGVWIGPEGDFSMYEMTRLKSAGVLPISLGRWVLRSETAAICALSVLNSELASRGGNQLA